MPDEEDEDLATLERLERAERAERDERDERAERAERDHPAKDDRPAAPRPAAAPNWFAKTFGSFFSGILGLVLFLGSFALLYDNEGRLDELAMVKNARAIDAASPPGDAQGQLVSATGPLVGGSSLGDSFIAPANYLALTREAEIYAWEEVTKVHPEKLVPIVAYRRVWTSTPAADQSFKVAKDHHNPPMGVKGMHWQASVVRLGTLAVDPDGLAMPTDGPVKLAADGVKMGTVAGNYLYLGGARPAAPRVGDTRLSYTALAPGGRFTVLGKLSGAALVPYAAGTQTFYRLESGSQAEVATRISREFTVWIWALRLLGFVMMWGGMRLMLEPFNALFDDIPKLNKLGRGMAGAITFPASIALSAITIGIAWITHSLPAMLTVAAVVLLGGAAIIARRAQRAATP